MTRNNVVHTKLNNGLNIIAEVNQANQSCGIGFFVKTGSRDEKAEESGVSHFLEHMLFKGSQKRSSLEITYEMGNIGAQSNAFTSEENTVYYGSVIPDNFSTMQEILSDMMQPALVQEEFDMEKKVILEEIALYQDRPHFYLYEHVSREFFNGHPAGNSVLGSIDSVSQLSQPAMRDYFLRRYSPSNMVLVATGRFDCDLFIESAEQLTKNWVNYKVERSLPALTWRTAEKEFSKKDLNQCHVILITGGSGADQEERYALTVLSVILGDSSGSRFYWDLIDKGLAEAASVESDEREGCGTFSAYAATDSNNLSKVIAIMRKIFSDPLNFSDQDLERAKTKLITRIVLSGELPMGRLMALGMEWNYRTRIHTLKEDIDKIQSISKNDVESALKKYPISDLSEFRLVPN